MLVGTLLLTTPAQASATSCEGKVLTVFGDSLVAGFGLAPGEDFPSALGENVKDRFPGLKINNAGVSGDTTTGGLARLDWSLGEEVSAVLLELGANDALRGISPEISQKNLDAMIVRLKERDIEVMLAGMLAPPNLGEEYGSAFNGMYKKLADKHNLVLYPFFLDGVAGNPTLNLPDGIHPTAEGIQLIVKNIRPKIDEFLSSVCN
ncbi:MAG: arylesterase [Pseudomonadota bacterium]